MIDLHAHILPAVDDGPADLEESLAMGRAAVEQGLTAVAATPHFFGRPSWSEIKERVAELKGHFAQAGLAVDLVAGAELMLDTNLLGLEAEEIPTYGDQGRFCLIEFPMHQHPVYTAEVLFDLQTKGITPIIAHPERYSVVRQDPNVILEWLEQGCLIQLNAGSILGRFGSQVADTAEILLTHDMVQFVASDAHHVQRRGLNLPEAYPVLVKLLSEDDANELVEVNPQAVLAGDFTLQRQPRPYQRRRFFFPFRRR